MRFGNWRGVTLAIALATNLIAGTSARADWFHHAIPKETPAMDIRTGGPYYAPPVPYGHYAKDKMGTIHGAVGGMKGHLMGLGSGLHGGGCSGPGCGGGHGGHGHGDGDGGCSGPGCGLLGNGSHGLFGHGDGGCGKGGCGGIGHGKGLGHGCDTASMFRKHHNGCDTCGTVMASSQAPAPIVSAQSVAPSGQSAGCGSKGCFSKGHHHHGSNAGCGLCGGSGLGIGGGHGFGLGKGLCGGCGGRGCGMCGGGSGNGGCGACGGKGCGNCLGKLGGLGSKAHGMLYGLTHPHAGKVRYFVGAGGPVPITPGYVPYVVTTRSPRDFLAFPPFTPER